jgi:hypothetical protein
MNPNDPDVIAAIEALKADRDRLQRVLERIASYTTSDGYRAGFYALRWHARTALTGEMSPTRSDAGIARARRG